MKKILFLLIIFTVMVGGAYYSNRGYQRGDGDAQSIQQSDQDSDQEQAPAGTTPQTTTTVKEKAVSFAIAGDVMLDRNVWHNYKDIGLSRIFDNFDLGIFKNADLSFFNLEGPISKTTIDDDWQSGSMVFGFPPESTALLKSMGLKAVSLANNHSYNAGKNNFVYTQQVLNDNGIANFGRQIGFNAAEDIYRYDGEIKISVIGLDALAEYIDSEITDAIKREKAAGRFVIMMPHWGTEYRATHDSGQRALAVKWIGVGVDMIVGSHPHVVEDFEVINGVPVVYSLGNFVFDQFFSPETQQGLVLTGKIYADKIDLTFNPTQETKVRPALLTGSAKTATIAKIFDIAGNDGFTKIGTDSIEIKRK